MDGLPKFENFSYQVNPFGLMEDFEVENFVPESDSNSFPSISNNSLNQLHVFALHLVNTTQEPPGVCLNLPFYSIFFSLRFIQMDSHFGMMPA